MAGLQSELRHGDGHLGEDRGDEREAAERPVDVARQAARAAPEIEQLLGKLRVTGCEVDVGRGCSRRSRYALARADDVALTADCVAIVTDRVAREQPDAEIGILIGEIPPSGERFIEAAELLEHRAPDR